MTAALEMSATATSQRTSEEKALDDAVSALRDGAEKFVKLSITEKRALLRQSMDRILGCAEAWARDGSLAKGISPDEGEEWLAGPFTTMRNFRLLDRSLARLERGAHTLEDRQIRRRPDGRIEVTVMPTDSMDGALFSGLSIVQLMDEGMDSMSVKEKAAKAFRGGAPKPGVSLILGAGNVSSIPPTDAIYKAMAEGLVSLIKVNPVNEWVGPHLERVFEPFISKGFMRVVYGAASVGKYLVEHKGVDDVHITGSNHTHDLIVWGPPGPERERRMREKDPILKKRITSELGNVSPVAVVPADYSEPELDFIARNIAGMVSNNGSFNCNAAKLLVTSKAWPQREALKKKIAATFERTPLRKAYYPGAFDRYEKLLAGRERVEKIGQGTKDKLPWTIVSDVDPSKKDDPIFSTEPFCSIISETQLDAKDAAEFVSKAKTFMNDTLWGTLNAMFIIPPALERSSEVGREMDRAIVELQYGTVAINQWPGIVFACMSPAWGGHPCGTLEDPQSGLGWVHNTFLLEGIEKTVLRGPLTVFPKPLYFPDNKKVAAVGKKLVAFEHSPSWLKIPGIAINAIQG
jgi:aldehyde dehydrogenase (NAD(P)+)